MPEGAARARERLGAGLGQHHSRSMEGVWPDSNSGSITYVKLHGGDIRLI
ncbi:hypothetical protein [Sorangium sp. So ce542]